jgi:hypothetical protein
MQLRPLLIRRLHYKKKLHIQAEFDHILFLEKAAMFTMNKSCIMNGHRAKDNRNPAQRKSA